jgi:DNA-binding HxlR family transcriptional regulator
MTSIRLSPTSIKILTLLKEVYPYRLSLSQIRKFIPMKASTVNGYLYWLMKRNLLTRYYENNSPKRYEYTITEQGFSALVRLKTIQQLKRILMEVS